MESSTKHFEDLEEEDDFLLELAAAEAEAEAASAKRPRVSMPDKKPGPAESMAGSAVEGSYMAALRGSKSEQWQMNPLNPGFKPRRVTASGGFNQTTSGGFSVNSNFAGTHISDAGEQDFPEKNCPCGVGLCLVLTSNTQKNPGRKFYKCPVREENGGCGFFQWCDAEQSSGTHAGTHSYVNTNDSKFPDHQCPCGAGSCRILTAKTGQNIGRQFYRCPTFEASCGFFKWCNDESVASSTEYSFTKTSNFSDSDSRGYQSGKTGTTCFKCGKDGHWARDCTAQSGNQLPETGRGKSSSSAGDCYRCGKDGHWARDCTAQSGNPLPETGRAKSSSSAGDCYKCGKDGHWARDCTSQSGNPLPETGRAKSSSSSGDCYKCGKPGHWARDCSSATSQSISAPGKRQRQY